MADSIKAPTDAELKAALGTADAIWSAIIQAIEQSNAPLMLVWKPSQKEFGRVCLLQHKKRTLLYLTPDAGKIWIAIVLGERAYELAMASSIPDTIKKMFSEARPYAEGRGIRFPLSSPSEIPLITKLVEIKTTPKR